MGQGVEVRLLILLLISSVAQASDWNRIQPSETVSNFNYGTGEYSITTVNPGGSTTQTIYPPRQEFEQSTPRNYIRNYREFEREKLR